MSALQLIEVKSPVEWVMRNKRIPANRMKLRFC